MTLRQAERWLARFERHGYVPYYSGIVHNEGTGSYGVNVDGDGLGGRNFGCPRTYWQQQDCIDFIREEGGTVYKVLQ